MPLRAGDRFGSYEIVGPLGAGGMGEVYRATDPSLGRQVAIKILPDTVAHDAERLSRFDREARLLASLNHPHIGAIFGREDSSGTVGLVLELVEGPTLAERLGRPMRWREARPLALQIVDAISCAHESGIVHRDLKPANIKITPAGAVKVLDFGLAKVVGHSQSDAGASQVETLAVDHTARGVILGTAAYMSPEQARGHDVDRQTDIWAFGCILYEMLTGRRAFGGDTSSDTIAAVIGREPDWSVLPADTPRAIRQLLRRCLAKNPKQRLRDIADAGFDLEADGGTHENASAAKSTRLPWAIAAILAIALSGAGAMLMRSPGGNDARERVSFVIPPPSGVQWGGFPVEPHPVPAPNGRLVAYSGVAADGTRLWIHDISSGSITPIPGVPDQTAVAWAPDSTSLVYCARDKLARVNLAGGASNPIDAPGCGWGLSLSQSGQVLYGTQDGIWRVSVLGGAPERIPINDPAKGLHVYPRWLPDGRRFVYLARDIDAKNRGIYLGSIDGGISIRLVPDESAPVFVVGPDRRERLVFVRGASLVSQLINVDEQRIEGDPVVLADRVVIGLTVRNGAYGASPTLLVHRSGGGFERTELALFDRTGRRLSTIDDDGRVSSISMSPDESTLAVQRLNPSRNAYELWQIDLKRGGTRPLRVTRHSLTTPVWSADSKRIAFLSDESGFWRPFLLTLGAESAPLQGTFGFLTDWSSDSKLVFGSSNDGNLVFTRTDGGDPVTIPGAAEPRLSPDMKWLAYRSSESGAAEIYVRNFPEGNRILRVSRNGGYKPAWRADGRELYFRTATGTIMAVAVKDTGTIDLAEPVPLFTAPFVPGNTTLALYDYAVTRDGQRFVAVLAKEAPIAPLTVVLNWLQ